MTLTPAWQNPASVPTRIHLAELGSLYLRGKIWWLEYWQEGTQHRESSKSQDERVARKLLKQRHAELNRDEFISPKNDRLLVKEFLEAVKLDYQLAGNRSQATLRWRLAPLLKSFGHLRASKLTTSMVDSYKAQRLEAGKAGATVNRELATLRRAYRLVVKRKLIAVGKVPTIDLLPENNAREGFLEPADLEGVVSNLPAYLQDFARFAYQSGWRKGEVQTLEW